MLFCCLTTLQVVHQTSKTLRQSLRLRWFPPPNITSLLQPMDQGVIAAFRTYYLRQSLQEMIRQTDNSGVSLKYVALEEVTMLCMKGMWQHIWPGNENCVINCDILDMLIKEISEIEEQVDLEYVDHVSITENLGSHSQRLSSEEFNDLVQQLNEQQ